MTVAAALSLAGAKKVILEDRGSSRWPSRRNASRSTALEESPIAV